MEKVLNFKENDFVDLTFPINYGYNTIQCGKDKYTLKDFKLQNGHDDSLPYSAILCVNDKPICSCLNDGWGGLTEIIPINVHSRDMLEKINKNLSSYGWQHKGRKFHLVLDFVADLLAEMNV